MYMELLGPWNRQNKLEKKEQSWRTHTSQFQNSPKQSESNKQRGGGRRVKGVREENGGGPDTAHTEMGQVTADKGSQTTQREKITGSSTGVAGTAECPHEKE